MADVFVSYARGDQALVEKIAHRLTGAGFSVWWDTELLPHNRFATIIESEIRSARAVLVVWSEAATRSQWVRAEAELGRQQDKLIQVAIDPSPVPLPFNQFQVADLRRWRGGAADPQWQKVLASVSHFTTRPEASADAQEPVRRIQPPARRISLPRSRRVWALGAAGVALAATGVMLVANVARPEPRGQRIAIRPFHAIGGVAGLQDFSTELTDSLQNDLTQDQLQIVSPTETASLKGDELGRQLKSLGVGLEFSGAVEGRGSSVTVSMQLEDPVQHSTLWTAELSGPAARFDQLQARVGALTVAVLNCSAQGLEPGANLSDGALQAFLHACELSETADHGLAGARAADAMLDAMRQAARVAPKFAAAHSVLAKHLAFLAAESPPDQAASLRSEAEREAHIALTLNPRDPDGLVTLGLLVPPLDFAKQESFFRQALAIDPVWPHANGFLGNVMTDVGRLQDAVTLYEKAASVNPQSVDWAQQAAAGLIRIGNTAEADRELARFSELWPGNFENLIMRIDSDIAQKRWADALKLVDQVGNYPVQVPPTWAAGWRQIFSALQSGDAAKRAAVRQSLLASASVNPQSAIDGLSVLGFTDDAFEVAQNDLHVNLGESDSTWFVFEVETARLRRDPRFMALAARFGLVDYWRRTGRWPDFCRDPSLPYNCQEVASKLS